MQNIDIIFENRSGDRVLWRIDGRRIIYRLFERNVEILGGYNVGEGTVSYNCEFKLKVQGRNRGEVAHAATSKYHGL